MHTRFSTVAVSTQRDGGLNRHFKHYLTRSSPLSKLFEEVIFRGAARLVAATTNDEVHASKTGTYTMSWFPTTMEEIMEDTLTGYGVNVM